MSKFSVDRLHSQLFLGDPAVRPNLSEEHNYNEIATLVERYRRGDFTPEEIHNFCHKLPETVSPCEFAKGCADYQKQLYGRSPDADRVQALETLILKMLNSIADRHKIFKAAQFDCPYMRKLAEAVKFGA